MDVVDYPHGGICVTEHAGHVETVDLYRWIEFSLGKRREPSSASRKVLKFKKLVEEMWEG